MKCSCFDVFNCYSIKAPSAQMFQYLSNRLTAWHVTKVWARLVTLRYPSNVSNLDPRVWIASAKAYKGTARNLEEASN